MDTNKSNTGLESVIKFFSLLYVLLVTCGLTYNYFFYKNFGITITEYIEFSESILLFIPLLSDGLIILIVYMVLWHFMNKMLLFTPPINIRQEFVKKGMRKAITAFSFFVLALIITLYILTLFGVKTNQGLYMLIAISIPMFLPNFLEMASGFFSKHWGVSSPPIFRDVIYIIIIIISITIWGSFSKTEKVYRKSGYKQFEIFFNNNDPKIQSDSSLYYLGRTKNYLFIYDFKIKKSRILNVSDIKEFTVSK